jgi:hypothetical protein
MDDFVALHGADDGDFVHLFGQFGEETVAEVKVVADGADVEVFLGAEVFFEVEAVDVGEGSGEFDDYAEAGGAAGVGTACGAGGLGDQRLRGEGAEETVATETEEVSAGWEKVREAVVHDLVIEEKLGAIE